MQGRCFCSAGAGSVANAAFTVVAARCMINLAWWSDELM
jgi:hypothetical protein